MVAEQAGWVEVQGGLVDGLVHQAPSSSRRDGEVAARRATANGPAFISDQAEVQHYLDTLQNPLADPEARASARMELARLLERQGELNEAIQLYQENIWAGIRTPATYARLAAAYRTQGRDDLADATLEQIRRGGSAADTARGTSVSEQSGAAGRHGASGRGRAAARTGTAARSSVARTGAVSRHGMVADTMALGRAPRGGSADAITTRRSTAGTRPRRDHQPGVGQPRDDGMAFLRQIAEPFLAARAGHRTLVGSMIVLPIAVGIAIVGMLVLSAARGRSAAPAPPPTPAPVATVAPTPLPTPAIPAALSQPPVSPLLVVANVGSDGLSLRRAPGSPDRIKVWPEGTQLTDLGQQSNQGGKSWRQVRAPDSTVGWVAAEFLVDPTTRSAPGGASAPAGPAFASGGLGLTREEWEQTHGQPSKVSLFLEYDDGQVIVGLSNSAIWHIERLWSTSDPTTLDVARQVAQSYMPADATLTQSTDRGDGQLVDVYSSPSLATRFSPTSWNSGHPGTFAIKYRYRNADDHRVTSAMFRLGDSPF